MCQKLLGNTKKNQTEIRTGGVYSREGVQDVNTLLSLARLLLGVLKLNMSVSAARPAKWTLTE